MNTKRFAALLKQKRTTLNLSQSKVAKQCFISKASYNHLEHGIRLPSLETLIRLSHVLETDPTEFIYAIITDGEEEETLHIPGLLKEDSPEESSYKRKLESSFSLLDQYQQKAVVDIVDSFITVNADNIK